MKVMVIPEDPVLDQYILKPIVERMLSKRGQRARVEVLPNPRIRGVAQALDPAVLRHVVRMYPMIDLFLIMVDRDGDGSRQGAARAREAEHPGRVLVCLAIEEVDVWMLALHRDKLAASWQDVRSEHHPKEVYAQPFLGEHAPRLALAGGRVWAMGALAGSWRGLLQVCEELADLDARIGEWLEARRNG